MKETAEALRLAYLGNLGRAHDVPMLAEFLQACTTEVDVEIAFIGTAESCIAPLRRLSTSTTHNLGIELHPPVAFAKLRETLEPMKFDYGIVSFDEKFRGLLSPSKFSGYLAASLPIVYLGPSGTNAAMVCERFGAGFRLDRGTLAGEACRAALDQMLGQRGGGRLRKNVEHAWHSLEQFDGEHLAREILRRARFSVIG